MAFRVLHGLLGNKNRINTVDLKVWVKHVFTLLIWKNIFFGSASASRFWLIFPNIARISSPNKEHLQTWTSIFRLLSMLGPIKSSPSSSWSVSSEMIYTWGGAHKKDTNFLDLRWFFKCIQVNWSINFCCFQIP